MRMLVSGVAGMIFSHFADMALAKGHQVIGLDGMFEGSSLNNLLTFDTNPNFKMIYSPVEHLQLKQFFGDLPDIIIQGAAFSNVDTSISAPSLFNRNYLATSRMLELARELSIPIILVGSDEEYGSWSNNQALVDEYSNGWAGFNEGARLNPSSAYSASKAASSLLGLSYFKTFNVDCRVTRCSNNFGTRQQDKFIPTMLKKLWLGEKVPIFKTPAERDWLHVSDHCEAIFTVINRGEPGEIYNISANDEKSPYAVLETFVGYDKAPELVEWVEPRLGYDTRYFCDSSKVRRLGWEPTKSLAGSIDELTEWYFKAFSSGYFN
jgi:dTDP-glucose 4,6-dehydratase